MKTTFDQFFAKVLELKGKTLADAALMSPRAQKAIRAESAKQVMAKLSTIRALRIEQEKKALEIQAAQMGMSKKSGKAPKVEPEQTAKPKGVVRKFPLADAFGLNVPETVTITMNNHNPKHPLVPKADPNYVFRSSNVSDLCTFLQLEGETFMYLYGPTGCGKSSLIIEAAARLGIPLYVVTGHSRMETPELIGTYKLNKDGGMDWIPGPVTAAALEDCWVLVDEIDLLDPAAVAGLNGITEGRSYVVPETGQQIVPGPNFRIFATGNTSGSGDKTGLYQGTLQQNLAFMDRAFTAEFSYPDADVEVGILEKVAPSMLQEFRERMVKFANEIREQFVNGQIEVTLSTRTLVRWARTASFYKAAWANAKGAPEPMLHAFDRSLGFRAEKESRQALHEVYQRHFGTI